MFKVQSSNIEAIGHEGTTLTIKFKSGTTWSYHDVPEHVHRELLNADSIGGHFAKHIRNHYRGTKHDEDSKGGS